MWRTYFPYREIRKFQDVYAEKIYNTLREGRNIVIQAVNGLGKTAAILSATLPLVEKVGNIIYLTRTIMQGTHVLDELQKIAEKRGVDGILLVGKNKMCPLKKLRNLAEDYDTFNTLCEYLRKTGRCEYFSNYSVDKQEELMGVIYPRDLMKISKDNEICPYYLMRKVLYEKNVVVANYLHVINPFLRRMLPVSRNSIIIFDECVTGDTLVKINERFVEIGKFVEKMSEKGKYTMVKGDFHIETRGGRGSASIRGVWRKRYSGSIYKICTDKCTVRVTENTLIWTRNGWKYPKFLKKGEQISVILEKGKRKIERISKIVRECKKDEDVYDLNVSPTHCFYGGGILVHNSHNLPEIIMDNAGIKIRRGTFELARIEAEKYGYVGMSRILSYITEEICQYTEKEEGVLEIPKFLRTIQFRYKTLPLIVQNIIYLGERIKILKFDEQKRAVSHVYKVGRFLERVLHLRPWEVCLHFEENGIKYLELLPLDPSPFMRHVLHNIKNAVFTSGTLEPIEAFNEILGLKGNSEGVVVPSPYTPERLLKVIIEGVTTRFELRDEKMFRRIIEYISKIVEHTPGNVGVFPASYDVLERLRDEGLEDYIDRKVFWDTQTNFWLSETTIKRFKEKGDKEGSVLVTVIGGRVAEGVDFPAGEMRTAIVVGIPFASPSVKLDERMKFLERKYPGRGKDLGYILPAIRKASQAAGRAVRSPREKAAIFFLDERYRNGRCFKYLPKWLKENMIIINQKRKVAMILKNFWSIGR